MLQKRIIVCLDVRDGKTTKGVRFRDNRDLGDPVEMAHQYYREGVDELVFYDITASAENRGLFLPVVRDVAKRIFIPFTVGGGIGSLADIREAILAGAEKVSLNSQAVKNPEILREGAKRFGRQCIVLGVDAKRDNTLPSGYRVYINGGRTKTDLDLLQWVKKAESLGAGEVVLNSIDMDGVGEGYDCNLTRLISKAVGIPVVASGGAGTPAHLAEVLTKGEADAALIASMVHFGRYSLGEIKEYLSSQGIPVRRD